MLRVIIIWIILAFVLTIAISTWKAWKLKSTFSLLKWSGYGILGSGIATLVLLIIVEIF